MKVAFSVNGEYFEFTYVESSINGVYPMICLGSEGKVTVSYGYNSGFAYPPVMDDLMCCSINDIMGCAFDNPEYFPDVVFVFPMTMETLFAHKAVLSARSKFFRMLFAKNPSPKVKVEVIAIDENPAYFRKVIQYLYTGGLSIESKMEAIDIIGLAAKYRLAFLAQRAQEAISHDFNSNGYSILFSLATLYDTTESVAEVIRFMDTAYAKGFTENTVIRAPDSIPLGVAKRSAINQMTHTNTILAKRDTPFYVAEPVHLFRRDMLWLAENPCFADVALAVSSDPDREVKCHRFMLALTSFYFKNVFQSMFVLTKQQRRDKRHEEEFLRAHSADPALQAPLVPPSQQQQQPKADDSQYTIVLDGMKFPRVGTKIKVGPNLIDAASVEGLMELGFPPDVVVWALLETGLNIERAADWLLNIIVTDDDKARLRAMISQTLAELKAAHAADAIPPPDKPPAGVPAGRAAKRRQLFYCKSCMALALATGASKCEGGCLLCEDCILQTFRKYLSVIRPGEPIPHAVACPIPSCSSNIYLYNVKGILGGAEGFTKSSFRPLRGQRGLARAERMMKRAPFKLVYPGEILSVKALKDYVAWLYSGFDTDLAVFRKKTNENIIKTAFNASDIFKDEHYKNALAKHKKLSSRYTIDKLYDWGNMFDCRLLINKCVKVISANFMDTFFERKYVSWSKELSERIMNGLLVETVDNYGMVPVATVFAFKNYKKYPGVDLFVEAYRNLYKKVNKKK